MTARQLREWLPQYRSMKKEVEELEEEIKDCHASDTVKASSTEFPYIPTTIRIEGTPVRSLKKIEQKRLRKNTCLLRIQEIDDFVNSIDNSRIRRVIIKRFIRGKQQPSWQSIAKDLEWSDEGTPRKAYEKYINNLLHSENSENGLLK